MPSLKYKDIEKMTKENTEKKLKELRLELVKSKVHASKTGSSKIKEIKKMIAKILTFNKSSKTEDKLKS